MEVTKMISEKGKVLLIVNNFKFCVANTLKDGQVRWRCTNKSSKCPSKLYTAVGNDSVVLNSSLNHNHAEDEHLERQIISNGAKIKAVSDLHEKPAKVIHKELREVGAAFNTITSHDINLIRHNIYVTKGNQLPPLPKQPSEVFASLEELAPKTNQEEPFLLVNNKEKNIVVFSCYRNLHFLSSLDGTFNFCPKFFKQFFTIHGLKNGHYTPLVFCLLTNQY